LCKIVFSRCCRQGTGGDTVFIKPFGTADMHFYAGVYILKLASGETWISDEKAFGEAGSYSSSEAFTFEEGGLYELTSSSTEGDFHPDNVHGFTGD